MSLLLLKRIDGLREISRSEDVCYIQETPLGVRIVWNRKTGDGDYSDSIDSIWDQVRPQVSASSYLPPYSVENCIK